MQAVASRNVVRNPRQRRTSSRQEVVEIRRRLAKQPHRHTTAQGTVSRRKRPTAELYVDDALSVDDAKPARKKKIKLALLGLSVTAAAALLAIIAVAGS